MLRLLHARGRALRSVPVAEDPGLPLEFATTGQTTVMIGRDLVVTIDLAFPGEEITAWTRDGHRLATLATVADRAPGITAAALPLAAATAVRLFPGYL